MFLSFHQENKKSRFVAFKNCEKLETIVLQKETKSIGQAAFLYSNVKAIVIPPTVKAIGTLPMKKPMEYLSIGMIENFPLTDKPVCTFNSDCIIYGYKDTEAERYANEWNLEFVTLESVTGDLNFDGEFNISNVVTLQKYLVKKEGFTNEQWKLADLNNDGTVNVFDVIILKRRIIYPGLHILSGDPKIGKSWMIMDMCLSIAKGEKFLGRRTEKGHVVYMALEDTFVSLQSRMYELTKEKDLNRFTNILKKFKAYLREKISNMPFLSQFIYKFN